MKDEKYVEHQSSIANMDANVIALLTYLSVIIFSMMPIFRFLSWLAPLLIFLFEKNSKFVKFHAFQSLLLNVAVTILGVIFVLIPTFILSINFGLALLGFGASSIIYLLIALLAIIISIIAMVKAYNYIEFHIPIIGNIAFNVVNK